MELDGFDEHDRLVVVAASNRLEDLDPALLRPGRFDRHVLISPPDLVSREQILGVHTRNKPWHRTCVSRSCPARPPG